MKLVGGAGPELLATLQRNLPEFSPSLIQRLTKGIQLLVQVGDKYEKNIIKDESSTVGTMNNEHEQ